jgi:competence protein ComEC
MTALVVLPRPADLRLVPAAAAVWAAVLLGLEAGPAGGGAAVALGVLVSVVALRRRGRAAAALATAAGCAAAAGLVITAHTLVLDRHPLRSAAERGSAATLHLVVRDDPRPLRATGPGPPQVAVPASLRAAEIAGRRWVGSGRVLLIAPPAGWSAVLPGQPVVADGLLAPATRSDLTVGVLRVRGEPRDIGPPPWWQRGAGSLREGLRTAAGVLPEASAALLPGLAVGDTGAMPAELHDDFRAAGLAHLTLR